MKEHREFVVGKLEVLTNRFIQGIRSNLHCFPPSLARLLRTIYSLLMSSGRAEPKEVNAVCVDIIFDLFICPAMVDPNPVGIIDTPISYIARSNLMQVAQILQVLALWKWEEIDPKLMDLYARFDKEVMSSLLESILKAGETAGSDEDAHQDRGTSAEGGAGSSGGAGPPVRTEEFSAETGVGGGGLLSRLAVLMTREELENVVTFLRIIRDSRGDVEEARDLASLLAPLPESMPDFAAATSTAKTNNVV